MLAGFARQWQDKSYWNRGKPFNHAFTQLFRSAIRPQYCSYRWIGFSEDDAKLIAGGASRMLARQHVEDKAFHRVTVMQSEAGAGASGSGRGLKFCEKI